MNNAPFGTHCVLRSNWPTNKNIKIGQLLWSQWVKIDGLSLSIQNQSQAWICSDLHMLRLACKNYHKEFYLRWWSTNFSNVFFANTFRKQKAVKYSFIIYVKGMCFMYLSIIQALNKFRSNLLWTKHKCANYMKQVVENALFWLHLAVFCSYLQINFTSANFFKCL